MAETRLDILTGTVKCLALVLYYWIVAIVRALLPTSVQAKDISGETVLITGAGNSCIPFIYLYYTLVKTVVITGAGNSCLPFI